MMAAGDETAAESEGPPFSVLLNLLFHLKRHPDGREYTNQEVSDWCAAQGNPLSRVGIYNLREGNSRNPSLKNASILAQFFEVSISWFVEEDEARSIAAQLKVLAKIRDSRLQTVAGRADKLSPEGLLEAMEHVEQLRQQERHGRRKGTE
ncbi:hypothetical protein [Sciscionella marina]|uniref:hypothetical protein n=1 Tax=Sciscionella marina TaxID=508770 RepID=UPI00036DDE7F|nr:hypothetical protein [Sciscionella marina]